MTQGIDKPETAKILAGLKDFQRSTVEHVFRRLYTDLDSNRRFLVADEVEAVIQINGKIKDRMTVSPSISDADFEAAALALPSIVAELAGATPKKVIARAPKLVNIVL